MGSGPQTTCGNTGTSVQIPIRLRSPPRSSVLNVGHFTNCCWDKSCGDFTLGPEEESMLANAMMN